MLSKRLKAAGFGVQKSFEDFDFRFNEEALPASVLRDLSTCHFIVSARETACYFAAGPSVLGSMF